MRLPSHMKLVQTEDNSPSIEISYSHSQELMHSSLGAFSETIYIYLSALEKSSELKIPMNILSIGLGLGYNELITIGYCLHKKQEPQITSYESDLFLRSQFTDWIVNPSQDSQLQSSYDKILKLTADYFKISPSSIYSKLVELFQNQSFDLKEKFVISEEKKPYNVVFYDPFSQSSMPDFWQDEFLDSFFKKMCANKCVISSYAATGIFKRCLEKNLFTVNLRPGFARKRNSTMAWRF